MPVRSFGSYTVEVSREDKILFPEEDITKGELMDYYEAVAHAMLPHLKDRPLTLQRFPDGIQEKGFYQKAIPDYFPDWVDRARIPLEKKESQDQVVVEKTATLVYLANLATITPHVWLSRSGDLDTPDRMVLDLDPSGDDFGPVREAALALRDILEEVGLVPFFMATGGSGGHVWTPLMREQGFGQVREFAKDVTAFLAHENPEAFTTEVRKNKRQGRLYLDVSRNAYGQTAGAPYAVRARRGAPVATPLDWEELRKGQLTARSHDLRSIPRRLGQKEDPWKAIGDRARSLEKARKAWQEKTGQGRA
jgi:bifunctional non-homologous end joining protein LigD